MGTNERRYRRYLRAELDRAALYRGLAATARKGAERQALLGLAHAEERHARHWAEQLAAATDDAEEGRLRWRTRLLLAIARRRGLRVVLPLLERSERSEIRDYDDEPAAAEGMAADERVHARVLASITPSWRALASQSLRASVFGVNDGLVSNLALVMAVAGAAVDSRGLLLTGLAGLLSGSLSMAAGEYVSVTAQRELLQSEVDLDADDVTSLAERDIPELGLLVQAKTASRETQTDEDEVDVLAPADHGLATEPPGVARRAALSNGAAFAVGASVPVVPFVLLDGQSAVLVAVVAGAVALFAVGAAISVVTGRSAWWSGVRQLLVGASAATATYLVGGLIGGALG